MKIPLYRGIQEIERHHMKMALVVIMMMAMIIIGMTVIVSGPGKVELTKPTIAIARDSIPSLFVLSHTGDLASYQASGKQTWQISASSLGFSSVIGNGTHLISDGHTLYTATDRLQASTSTGHILWQHSLSAPAKDLLQIQQTLYVLSENSELSAWASTNGMLLWLQSGASFPLGPWAALQSDGHLLFLGGEGRVIALDTTTGKIVWQHVLDPGDGAERLVVAQETLLVQTGNNIMALQHVTGKVLWQAASQIQSWYVNAAEDLLYTASIDVPDPITQPDKPTWSGFRARNLATGTQLWAVAQPLTITGMSSIAANGIVSSAGTSISAWDLQGKQLWQHTYAGSPITQVVMVSQTATDLIFAQDGTLTAFNNQHGTQQWQWMLTPDQDNQLIISHSQYWIIGNEEGDVAAYSFQGIPQWSLALAPFADVVMQ